MNKREQFRIVATMLCKAVPKPATRVSVAEWAERHRILPQGISPMPGPWRWSVVPYLREIADCFSERSPVRKVAVMKGAQLGFTTGVLENAIGYVIASAPGPSLYIGADKGSSEANVELRVDRMIESAGLGSRIFSQSEKKNTRKTGDTKAKKEFPGGFLLAAGSRVGSKLRSFSVRYLMCDEVDAYPLETGSEGDPIALAEKRTVAFEAIRKIMYGSTPLVAQTSKIAALYLRGDQRKYYVPCKHCGHMQPLIWRDEDGNYRLKYEIDEMGRLIWDSVHYECEKCGGAWRNADKAWFLPRGEWRATAEPMEPNYRSYHISALYSPVGMRSWGDVCQEWIDAHGDTARLRAFVNLTLGEPFEEHGLSPRYERVMIRSKTYTAGTLPDLARPLILTLGADVQADRIECEIVAWGKDRESWSVSYHVLPGDTEDPVGAPWRALHALLAADHGAPLLMALVDAGYNTSSVYQFCERFESGVMPTKGVDGGSRGAVRNIAFRAVDGHPLQRVDLNTGFFKELFYGDFQKSTPDGKEPTEPFPGYCHFPIDYDERHFRQLTAEERVLERTRDGRARPIWRVIRGRRNEQLDCRVYATAALYVLYARLAALRPDSELGWPEFWRLVEGSGNIADKEVVG